MDQISNTSELLFLPDQAVNIIMYTLRYKHNRQGKKVLLKVCGQTITSQ